MDINCEFFFRGECLLGWFGGKPKEFNCKHCLKNGDNTHAAKEKFDQLINTTHPQNKPKVGGCCDRADQA
jgi:hypothetical protein